MSPSNARVVVGTASLAGRGRRTNEDSLSIPDGVPLAKLARKGHLYVVADGIGGHRKGEVASRAAVETIQRTYYNDPASDPLVALRRSIEAANRAICQLGREPHHATLGSTVVASVIRGDYLVVASVGDSRAYLLRKGTLKRLTKDHTWVAERVAAGVLTAKEAAHHDMRHIVTRSLGGEPSVQVDVQRHRLRPGDRLLLCTDGVWEPIPRQQIARVLAGSDPQDAAAVLVEQARAAGGSDDSTGLVVARELAQTGVLSRPAPVVGNALSSSPERSVAIGITAILALALLICGSIRLLRNADVRREGSLAVTRDSDEGLVSDASGVDTAAADVQTETRGASSAAQPPPTVTSSSGLPLNSADEPIGQDGKTYCVAPIEGPRRDDQTAANSIDPETCQTIPAASLPVGDEIWVRNQSTYTNQCGLQLIQVAHGDRMHWIYAWRIGTRAPDGTCQPISNWLYVFAAPREP